MRAPSQSIQPAADEARAANLCQALRRFWHPVAYTSELSSGPLSVTLLGQALVVVRLGERLSAMRSRCPHKGANLALGCVVNDTLECAYHGWRFDGAGKCVRVPAREEMVDVIRAEVESFAVAESAGIVWVALEPPLFPPPSFPELQDPAFRVLQGAPYDWQTSPPRRLENFVDFAHFAFVHDGTIGSRSNPRVESVEVWREDHVLRFNRSGVKEPGVGLKKQLLGLVDEWIEPVNEYHVFMPHTVHLKRIYPNGKRYVLFMAASPIDAQTTRSFWWQARDFGTEQEWDGFFMDFEAQVLAQDKPIIESQRPLWFHLGRAPASEREIPVRHADVVTVEYRKWLASLLA